VKIWGVLRRGVGEIFGFNREIADLRRRVDRLSWDTAYDMWTREAFLQLCRVMPRGTRAVVFIDLDRIRNLNEQHGYTEVNRKISAAFSIDFRRSDIVARWFSGDEIVILFDTDRAGAELKIAALKESAEEQGLTFKYEIGEWQVGLRSIEDVVRELADSVVQHRA